MRGPVLTEVAGGNGKPLSSAEVRRELDRIVESDRFRGATGLQNFLKFITTESIEGRSSKLKESRIGTEVFGRGEDFDGKTDNVVRVQAHRLRARLKDYYQAEGATDPVLIEIPKGHYVPRFRRRDAGIGGLTQTATLPPATKGETRRSPVGWMAGVFLCGLAVGAAVTMLVRQPGGEADRARIAEPLAAIWSDFWADEPEPVIVSYANHIFLETDGFDLLRYTGPHLGSTGTFAPSDEELATHTNPDLLRAAERLRYNTNITSVGAVEAVQRLTHLFSSAGASLRVRRSVLLDLDDLKNHSVIYVGGPYSNDTLGGVWGDPPLRFEGPTRIVNGKPRPGEPPEWRVEWDSQTGTRTADHAMFAVLPGLAPDRRIAVIGGMWTEGTYGASQFATSEVGARELREYFGGVTPDYFQVVLRCDIVKGEVSKVRIVTGRKVSKLP